MRTHTSAFPQPRAARLSPLAGALALVLTPAAHALTYTVTDAGDVPVAPAGLTLREAIEAANANCLSDPFPSIKFSGPFTISPAAPLPPFVCATNDYFPVVGAYDVGGVTLNGPASFASCGLDFQTVFYGGRLYVQNMKIQNFNYGSFSAGVCGQVDLHDNTFHNNGIGALLRGASNVGSSETSNVFTSNSTAGIWAYGGGGSTITRNLIGTPNGTTADGNGDGIYVGGGGSIGIYDNVISGNTARGVRIINDSATFDSNKIGTNAAGTGKLANGGGGVWLQNSFFSSFNGDLIGGNGGPGVEIDNSDVILFQNAYIGVNPSGTAIPNTRGIDAFCSGYLILDNSYVSSNSGDGMNLFHVYDSEFTGNTISNNGGTGIRLSTDPLVDCSSSSNNLIHNGNTIGDNGQNGVLILGNSTQNLISDNLIFGSGVKNISLGGGTAPLPNDPDDSDIGPNEQQNWPIIDSVVQNAGQTIITFHIESTTGSNIDIEAYANAAFGKPAAEYFLESTTLCGDCSEYSGTLTIDGLYDNISLTATVNNNTSELSPMGAALTAPAVQLSRDSIDFGDVQVNGSSTPRSVTLRSIGGQPYVIDTIDESGFFCSGYAALGASVAAVPLSICYGGGFQCTTNCSPGSEYATNQTCSITATFAPTSPGFYATTIYICDNSAASPNTVQLFGNAILPPPIRVSPAEWDFGNVQLGSRSEARQFVVSNDYGGSIAISLESTGDFEIVGNDCGGSVPGEGSCNVSVEFVPTRPGEVDGELLVRMASEPAKALVLAPIAARANLIGTGVSGGSLVLPESIDVGAALVGGAPATRTVELVNEGSDSVTFSSVTVSANFGVVNNCPTVLAAGASCTLVISFTAPAVGPFTGTLTVVTDATEGSALIPLTALGQLSPTALLRILPTFIGFGDRVIGSQSGNQQVVITNVGGAAATLSLSTSSIDYVIASTTCTASLDSQASCFANVAFRPLLGFGPRPGAFIVNSNTAGSPHSVSLDGTGCRPYLASGGRSGSSSNCAP